MVSSENALAMDGLQLCSEIATSTNIYCLSAQIARALAKRLGWDLNIAAGRKTKATEAQHVALQHDCKVALERAIEEFYGDQLPQHAFKYTLKVRASVRSAAGSCRS